MELRSLALLGALVSVALGSGIAAAGPVPTRLLDLSSESVVLGMAEMRERFLTDSLHHDREHVGAVLRMPDGSFRFSHGVGPAGQDSVSFRIARPARAELVGFWHTHGRQALGRDLFSPADTALVLETRLPFYLITPSGDIKVLRPDHVAGTARRLGRGRSLVRPPRGSARGIVVQAARP